jgi:hypothetical protein
VGKQGKSIEEPYIAGEPLEDWEWDLCVQVAMDKDIDAARWRRWVEEMEKNPRSVTLSSIEVERLIVGAK